MKVGRHSIIRRSGAPARTRVARGRVTRLIAFTLSTESCGLEPDTSGGFFSSGPRWRSASPPRGPYDCLCFAVSDRSILGLTTSEMKKVGIRGHHKGEDLMQMVPAMIDLFAVVRVDRHAAG